MIQFVINNELMMQSNPERLDSMKRSINEKVNTFTVKSNCIVNNTKTLAANNAGDRVAKNIARQFNRGDN
jgi:hypothetical protein